MQYTKGHVAGEMRISGARYDKLLEIWRMIPKRIRATNPQRRNGTHNRDTLIFQAEYGPVWGGWESDIRKAVDVAINRAGSSGKRGFDNLKRTIVARRVRNEYGGYDEVPE